MELDPKLYFAQQSLLSLTSSILLPQFGEFLDQYQRDGYITSNIFEYLFISAPSVEFDKASLFLNTTFNRNISPTIST